MLKKMTLSILPLTASLALLASCSVIPPEAYYDHGSPESLMDQSSEVVNFDLGSESSLNDMVAWINQDQPSRAELYCTEGDPVCSEANQSLQQFGVPVNFVTSGENVVTLVYDRVLARDCENRYIDNSINPYNLDHPTYGCSLASNMVQMVTDKRQFTSPALLDYHDGERIERMLDGYKKPYSNTEMQVDPNFTNNRAASLTNIGAN